MRAYGDESGIHAGATQTAVAGLMGTPGQWEKFDVAWRKMLKTFRAPYFHSKEFFNPPARLSSTNPYRGWDEQKDDAFIEALLKVIDDHRVKPVGAVINVNDFMALSYGERCWLSGGEIDTEKVKWVHHGSPNVPYHVGLYGFIADAHTVGSRDTRIHFILESQNELSSFPKLTWDRFKRMEREEVGPVAAQLGSMGFASSEEEVSLQAADLVAYELFNTLHRQGRLNRRHRTIMKRLIRKRDTMQIVDAAYLESLLAALNDDKARKWLRDTPDPESRSWLRLRVGVPLVCCLTAPRSEDRPHGDDLPGARP